MSNKRFGQEDAELAEFTHKTFAPVDAMLDDVLGRSRAAGLPDIAVSPLDGRLLEVLARTSGARKAVEIGTLGGYSGVCLMRGMGTQGRLWSFELEPVHADVAKESFRRAGFVPEATVLVGPALDRLPSIEKEGPFDLVFVDADKVGYPKYLAWAHRNLRPGGIALLDNAFLFGGVNRNPAEDPAVAAMQEAWKMLADRTKFTGTVIPTGEGLAIGVRV